MTNLLHQHNKMRQTRRNATCDYFQRIFDRHGLVVERHAAADLEGSPNGAIDVAVGDRIIGKVFQSSGLFFHAMRNKNALTVSPMVTIELILDVRNYSDLSRDRSQQTIRLCRGRESSRLVFFDISIRHQPRESCLTNF